MEKTRNRVRSLALAALAAGCFYAPTLPAQSRFIRGEMNGDGRVDLTDAVAILLHLFGGASGTGCVRAGDVDDSGDLDITDPLALLGYLFTEGLPPRAPFPDCGADPTEDPLSCTEHVPCLDTDRDPVITEWTVPWAGSRPRDPYAGDGGRVWFVGQTANYLAFLDPEEGSFKRFDLSAGAAPHNLIVDGLVWYAGNGDAHIGSLDPDSGKITIYPMPDPAASDPHTMAFDRSGDIWFTVQRGNFVGRLAVGSGEVKLIPVPTRSANPYGLVVDSQDRPWFAEFGTNKLAMVDRAAFTIREFPLPRSAARPRRLEAASDGSIWYVDYAQGYVGRLDPTSGESEEWRAPGGSGSSPYGMAIDHRDRIWFVETGSNPNRMVGFNPATKAFFGITAIPSGGGTVRHMSFHEPSRSIWFGTDAGTIGRARVE